MASYTSWGLQLEDPSAVTNAKPIAVTPSSVDTPKTHMYGMYGLEEESHFYFYWCVLFLRGQSNTCTKNSCEVRKGDNSVHGYPTTQLARWLLRQMACFSISKHLPAWLDILYLTSSPAPAFLIRPLFRTSAWRQTLNSSLDIRLKQVLGDGEKCPLSKQPSPC